MLRLGLGAKGGDLGSLCAKARKSGWMPPAVSETANKLDALRDDSDAHKPGTEQHEIAQFALHLAGSVLLYLGDTFPGQIGT